MTGLQSEYSLWARDPEAEVLPACDELGVGFIPWSPLGQGFLTGNISPETSFDNSDVRSRFPRFTSEALRANQPIVELLNRVASRYGATPAQIALAWLLAQQPWIIPIPGTRKLHRLEENLGAADLKLAPDDVRELDSATAEFAVHGGRGTGNEQYS